MTLPANQKGTQGQRDRKTTAPRKGKHQAKPQVSSKQHLPRRGPLVLLPKALADDDERDERAWLDW